MNDNLMIYMVTQKRMISPEAVSSDIFCIHDLSPRKVLPINHCPSPGSERGGGGGLRTRDMKCVGMLVVSLRGVNFGFWSHLRCSGQNAIIFSREGLV